MPSDLWVTHALDRAVARAAPSTPPLGSRAKLVKNEAKAHTTIDVSDLSERLRLGQLTESLQQQLDESERRLQAAQSNMEHRAATALQFSVRLRAKQREVRGGPPLMTVD